MIIGMPWCDNIGNGCPRPDDYIGTPQHTFNGYGFRNVYHPECCPLHFDGTSCSSEHPEPMAPNSHRLDPVVEDARRSSRSS